MRLFALPARARLIACAAWLGVALAAAPAWAVGEEITDVRIMGNQRTEESTVRSVAGVSIGDTLETGTLDLVRERLNTTGLFSDVNVWWEQYKTGVRVNIAVKDKFPWAPVPTGSWSANNRAFGLLFVHGNLFGRGKQMLLGGRLADVDSGAALAYRDPSFFGTWIFWQVQANVQRQNIPEYYTNDIRADQGAYRSTLLVSYAIEPTIGVAWWRRVRTQVAWRLEQFNYDRSYIPNPMMMDPPTVAATQSARTGIGKASLNIDFRAREFAVMTGTVLGGGIDFATPDFGGDLKFWRVGGGFQHGVKFFKSHNLVLEAGATFGKDMPFWMENTAGGPNLRGYLYQQFRGDSQIAAGAEYHFPLFSISSLDFRALVFYDAQALWFRNVPTGATQFVTRDTPDQRTFLVDGNGYPAGGGFDVKRDIHQSVGGGVRFFLRSVAVPLIGFDAGWGLESRSWRFTLVIGA
jgi:outer membrane protein insertion porin family